MGLKKNSIGIGLLLLIILIAAACTRRVNQKPEPPADLIPRDTMVSIFVDMRLMDAVVNYEQRQGRGRINDTKFYLYNSIMEKYGITREQFESSFDYYQDDLNVIDQIYADAIIRLSKLKSQVEQEQEQEE